jgi:hydrogenase expression/formation protein HypC
MCLSVIGKIIKVNGDSALIDLDGIKKEVSITLKPNAKKGDYVLLHAGFVIEIMQSKEAKKALKDIKETEKFNE